MAIAAYIGRAIIGSSLILSAVWKLRHPADFRVAFRQSVPSLARHDRFSARAIPFVEIVVGIGCLVVSPAELVFNTVALALVAVFLVSLLRKSDARAGCGCWRGPVAANSIYAIRNSLLILFGLIGFVRGGEVPLTQQLFGTASGLLIGVLILESPSVISLANYQRKGGTTG